MLVHPVQLLKTARESGFIVGAFNVFNIDYACAVLKAAVEERSPVILQISMGARKYQGDWLLFVSQLRELAQRQLIPAFVQHDHCLHIEACKEAVDAGVQAVMFDGSHLSYEENVANTREVVAYAHARGVAVEAELGCLPGFEDMVFAGKAVFTDPKQAAAFVNTTDCDSLAVSVGTSHGGVIADAPLPIAFDTLREIGESLPCFPLVLHGAASLPGPLVDAVNAQGGKVAYLKNAAEADIAACAQFGVSKANMDVDNFLAFTTAVRQVLNEYPEQYDPRKYLAAAKDALCMEVRRKMRDVLRSAGHA